MKFGSTATLPAARSASDPELLKEIEAKRAELAETRERNAKLRVRHQQLVDRQAALQKKIGIPNPSEGWQIEQVGREIAAVRSELESGEEAALAYELSELEQPIRRTEEKRTLGETEKEDAELAQLVQDCRAKILKKAGGAVAKQMAFNDAHREAERAAGETAISSRVFDYQTAAVIRILWGYGSESVFEWERRMRGDVVLGDYSVPL